MTKMLNLTVQLRCKSEVLIFRACLCNRKTVITCSWTTSQPPTTDSTLNGMQPRIAKIVPVVTMTTALRVVAVGRWQTMGRVSTATTA